MNDLISRQEAVNAILHYTIRIPDYMSEWGKKLTAAIKKDLIDDIEAIPPAPAVDPADVVGVHRPVGEWEYYKQGLVRCSQCHDCYIDEMYIEREKWRFCPTCGARLKYERSKK